MIEYYFGAVSFSSLLANSGKISNLFSVSCYIYVLANGLHCDSN